MSDFTLQTDTSLLAIAVRLGLACVLGFLIGFEREIKDRPAGLRTHMLTALAAAAFAIIAIEFIAIYGNEGNGTQLDPIRVVEAVTAGVAFLAAGTIIQARGKVQGLTTGAGMWLAGAIGLACGAGFLTVALVAAGFALLILVPMKLMEKNVFREDEPGLKVGDGKDEHKKD
ncbi:MgtC/SapB family protein [Henriciella sp.]|uniref:MgtC/SapB family protein n=1 Tax=Henriciella sp. TaxID=1968823 RepID=UPI00260BC14A|nr:MgtC/SapB family protein [Henriciella sp.]